MENEMWWDHILNCYVVELGQNREAWIDVDDYAWVKERFWRGGYVSGHFFALQVKTSKPLEWFAYELHIAIARRAGIKGKVRVLNGKFLDCRRFNLRAAR